MTDTGTPTYQTRLETVSIKNAGSLTLNMLKDRQQYSDPDGVTGRLGISPALWPLSGQLWPSAFYLATALAQRPVDPLERTLELGCGLALPSLISHRRGADITASDHHPLALHFLEDNLARNQLSPGLPFRYGHWGEQDGPVRPDTLPDFLRDRVLRKRYHLIIGSDLLYERCSASHLAAFIHRHAHTNAQAWIVDANRGHAGRFKRHMASHGFEVKAVEHLNRRPCLSGAAGYKGRLLKFRRH